MMQKTHLNNVHAHTDNHSKEKAECLNGPFIVFGYPKKRLGPHATETHDHQNFSEDLIW